MIGASGFEAHVFLAQGKLAWAYHTGSRSPFLEHLRGGAEFDRAVIAGVLEEARRLRRPPIEMLVSRGITDAGRVREAVRVQIAATLRAIESLPTSLAVFHQRSHQACASSITFSLEEVQGTTLREMPASATRIVAPAPNEAALVNALQPEAIAVRVERGRGQTVLQRTGAIARRAGAVDVVLRATDGYLYSAHTGHGDVWGHAFFRGTTALGPTRANAYAALDRPSDVTPPRWHDVTTEGEGPLAAALDQHFESFDMVGAAALVVTGTLHSHTKRRSVSPQVLQTFLRLEALAGLDAPTAFQEAGLDHQPGDPLGLNVTLTETQIFGVRLDPFRSAWFALRRGAMEGYGWALLSLARGDESLLAG
ncbi:Hypothetical protein A7982_09566 [Minicystis rosea]|nr:Hypothetical protein A7982_09566 [Minicystis rosea]